MKKSLMFLFLVPGLACAHNIATNIKVVPLKDMPFPVYLKEEMQNFNDNEKQNGFVQMDSDYPRKLLSMRNHPLKFEKSDDPAERELKKSISAIHLTFTYRNEVPNSIAYAEIGIVSDKGFSGIKEFFDGKELGVCTLSTFNRLGATQPIQLNEDGLRYDVNDKPTRVTIEGNQNAGFMYSVRWFDKDFVRDLECANLKYENAIIEKMIVLANEIDKQ